MPAPPRGHARAHQTAVSQVAVPGRARGVRSPYDPPSRELQRPEERETGASRQLPDRPPALGEQDGASGGPVLARLRRAQPVQRVRAREKPKRGGVRPAAPSAGAGAPPAPPPPPPPPTR